MNRWWVVVNPAARCNQPVATIEEMLSSHEVEHTVQVLQSPAAMDDLIARGIAAGYTDFAVVGGDDSANLVLNALMSHQWESPPTLAILSTSSDFIRTFALPSNLDEAATHLLDDQRYPTDIGLVEGAFGSRYFLNAANAGVAARAAALSTRFPTSVAFGMAVAGSRPADVRVEADGRTLQGNLMNVLIANGQFSGGGLNVAPRATVQDGVFDVQLFSGSRREAPMVLARLRRGSHLTLRSVRRTKGSEIAIHCPDSWPIEADGEPIGHGPITVRVLPRAILFKI